MELLLERIDSEVFSKCKNVLEIIASKYLEYCEEWDNNCDIQINMNKKYICDIYSLENGELDNGFKESIEIFNDLAEDLRFDLIEEIDDKIGLSDDFKFSSRIKTRESLIQKILKKMNEENGKIKILKLINDLLGLRIVVPSFREELNKINNLNLTQYKAFENCKIRILDRNLATGYKAYHIYIRRDNKTFPIELQIWDKEDEENNINLHTDHKEEYVKNIIEDFNKY
ncbi:MAG: hypothetical protein RSB41_03785 [Bacilli bacterium]